MLLKLVLLLFAALLLLPTVGIIANRLPLWDPPGFWPRIQTYLTTHVAETADDSPYPELRLPPYLATPQQLFEAVLKACHTLHWQIVSSNAEQLTVSAVVTTRLFRFKDDVELRVLQAPAGGARLYVHSSSRIGKGDLGANTRHLLNLFEALAFTLPS
jgi:uncharacterized protein (DUF1499 family)